MAYEINFPTWEEIKALNKDVRHTCVLFDVFGSVYGRLAFYENGKKEIIFDMMCHGLVNEFYSPLMPEGSITIKANKKEYEKLKKQVAIIFNSIIDTMIQSAQEDKVITGEY